MAGVYISYPFCSQKCTYCNFASDVFSAAKQREYEAALARELARHRWEWKPETLYLGGGTPSLMPLEALAQCMAAVPTAALSEITLECAPGTVTPARAEAWAGLGINRVSLGVQSFLVDELRRTGRRHTAEIVRDDMALLANCGIANVNVDLIAGLPGQTVSSWNQSLEWIGRLDPAHVSVYMFEIDEDSRLGREATLGGVRYGAGLLPSDDLVADLYEAAVSFLASLGIARYEISNFARPSFESRHNLKYWRGEPYAGFGMDAHSFDGARRWSNPDTLDEYLGLAGQNHDLREEACAIDPEEEHFFVGLRLAEGIEPTPAERTRFSNAIERSVGTGLLERDGARLRLTARGVLLSNEVFAEFIHA
jgi:oxygen-independent coproporphyrinogen III oxidase